MYIQSTATKQTAIKGPSLIITTTYLVTITSYNNLAISYRDIQLYWWMGSKHLVKISNKGNNKITGLRTILRKGKSKLISIYTDKISQQPENCENRKTDLVQAFLKKWWVESDFKAPNLPLSLWLKGSGCHYNSIYNNTGTK